VSRPRIRSIKPEAWQDERVGALSRDARLLLVGLITMADDEGRLRAQPSMLIGSLYPWDEVSPRKLMDWLNEIEREGLVLQYEHDGKPYVAFRNWKRHQRINRPSPSLLPAPPDHAVVRANSVNDHGTASTISTEGFTPSRGRGSDRIGKDQEPPQPPEQARGEQDEQEQAPPVRKNSRALRTNPRALDTAALAVEADERQRAALDALSAPAIEHREQWAVFQDAMQAAVGDGASRALYVDPLYLAAVNAGCLVLNGDEAAMGWNRGPRLVELCARQTGISARLATPDEHVALSAVTFA
jgi:hypothetical protein